MKRKKIKLRSRVEEMKQGIGIRSVDAGAKLFPISFSLSQLFFFL